MEKPAPRVGRRVIVRGRVQGVGFRWATRQQALLLGLCGTVGNAGDGSVHIEAEGSADAVSRLIGWLDHGPPGAAVETVEVESVEVESVEVEEAEAGSPGRGFVIR
jgi:acylphosphatase